MKKAYLIVITILLFTACGTSDDSKQYDVADVPDAPAIIDLYTPEIDSIYNQMTPKDKINELIWLELSLPKQLKKEVILPNFGYLHTQVSALKNITFDSSKHLTKVFAKDLFEPFHRLEKSSFNRLDLTTVTDTTFWKNYHKTYKTYCTQNNIAAIIQDSILGIDSIFRSSYDSLQSVLIDSLIKHKLLIGNQTDSVTPVSNDLINRAPIAIHYNADSISDFTDSTCHIHLKAINWSDVAKEQFIEEILLGHQDAAHIIIKDSKNLENFITTINSAEIIDLINEELLSYKVRKSIALKLWGNKKPSKLNYPLEVELKSLAHQASYKSISLIKNEKGFLPIKDYPTKKWKFIAVGKSFSNEFRSGINHYGEIGVTYQKLGSINFSSLNNGPAILLIDQQKIDSAEAQQLQKAVNESKFKCIVVNIGYPQNLLMLSDLSTLVQCWSTNEFYGEQIAQLIMGGNSFSGGVLNNLNLSSTATTKTRLSYTIPEEVGIASDSLKKIDKIAAEAVWGGVTPGCQVFIAKEGKVICNKGYGYHTYSNQKKVNTNTTYDIASVTKVASTTLCGMHMYDKGYYQINDSLKLHLPDSLYKVLGHFSRLHNVTFHRLFTHTSGLPAGLPIYKYMVYTDSITGPFDKYYCDVPNEYFKVEVAKNFYMDSAYLDSLWLAMNNIWTGEKKYKYSDANMNVLYQIFRSKLNQSQRFEKYMDSVFYSPLHLDGTTFLPLKYLDTIKHPITPTENEKYWRNQLIKGYAHDPNAAIYGGVAGNAGLFSNANDLGVIMQMLMNKGAYGSKQYLQAATVKRFTRHQEGSHRGLGFDKPTQSSGNVVAPDCPYTAYGHTGFTGICVWNDPENDLVFVFTSNRVHPNANNKKIITFGIRKRLHQVIYDQLYYNGQYKNEATKNIPVTRVQSPA